MNPITYHSISDLYDTLGLPADREIDFTILNIPDIHKQIPFQSPVLKADYFSFILTKDGAGVYSLDDHKFPFDSYSVYFTNPGHTKSYELYRSKEAYIIMVTESFLREYVHPKIYDEFNFLLAEIVPPKTLSENTFKGFENIYEQIREEFNRPSIYKKKILGNLLAVLLLKIKEEFWLQYDPLDEGTRNSQIIKSFQKLLEKVFAKVSDSAAGRRPQVKDLAEELNLHPNYLNSVIRLKTGKSVNEWLTARTLATAKMLLRDSSLSTKEIAYKLGFSEATHFNRFFKHHINTTPGQFRKNSAPYK